MTPFVHLAIAIVCSSFIGTTGVLTRRPHKDKRASKRRSKCNHCQEVLDVIISRFPAINLNSGRTKHFSTMLNPVNISKDILNLYDPVFADKARMKLVKGSTGNYTPSGAPYRSRFTDVQISFPLDPPYIHHPPHHHSNEGDKNIIPPTSLSQSCEVYGAGIANESGFESSMAALGCRVDAFDCTIPTDEPSVVGKKFAFHQWCLGTKQKMGTDYSAGDDESRYVFKSIPETMKELNHSSVDVLKFDIEGFEWGLFENDIFNLKAVPLQLAFELHTEGANPRAVPPNVVAGRSYVAVNKLFLKLYDQGYRVISKEINGFDSNCAEFVMVNVDKLATLA